MQPNAIDVFMNLSVGFLKTFILVQCSADLTRTRPELLDDLKTLKMKDRK